MENLKVGESYTRIEIHRMFGGSTEEYMPFVAGAVVCLCVTKEMNPDAPETILAGKGRPAQLAEIFLKQDQAVPVFVKRQINEWVYAGNYRAKGAERTPSMIAQLGAHAGRLDVVLAIYLEKVK